MVIARQITDAELDSALGPFDALQPIGAPSGSGECWRVERGGQVFAVKLLVRQHEPGRFQREVEALKRLSSPRVMHVIESGTVEIAGTDYPFLKSEFVDGADLRSMLQARRLPDDPDLRDFLIGCLEGLAALAGADIVHRDLKPENIVLPGSSWGSPVIIDLGLCRLLDKSSLTVYPWAGGTWPYMAPEQLRGERAIPRSDIWALAVITAELATGNHPFLRGEAGLPNDWDQRLRQGMSVPGSRPAALASWLAAAGDYRAYRRPDGNASKRLIEESWV